MRGTFVFPQADTDFMQLIEVRGNNGAQDDIETVYVLTGETYLVPTRLLAFDDPSLYREATRTRVHVSSQEIAETVVAFSERVAATVPKLVVVIHTHPSGRTAPSQQDEQWSRSLKDLFDDHIDDYEFFFGIHGLQDTCKPDPDWLRRPAQTAEHKVSWWGENRKHTLALYNAECEPRRVVVR